MLNVAIADLREKLSGSLLTPDAPDYDATRKVFNGMVNKRPALIARCASTRDVVACIHLLRTCNCIATLRTAMLCNLRRFVSRAARRGSPKPTAGLVAYVQLRFDATSQMILGERPVEIQRYYVDASHHGAGLAHQLMTHVVARAEAAGSTVLWLGVWERNPRALAFYRKWGFDVVAEQIFTVGNDPQRDLIMRLNVQSEPRL